jgi:hypothetical protein
MGNSRTHRVASLNESTTIAVEAQCLMKAGRHGGTRVEVRVSTPAAPGFLIHHQNDSAIAVSTGELAFSDC